jgi:hypothetical protein
MNQMVVVGNTPKTMSNDCEPDKQPCGNHHPLPCGLDVACPVLVEYFDPSEGSREAWDRYREEEFTYG